MTNKITIHGPSGSGKSTLGISLAQSLGLKYIELDREIQAGKTLEENQRHLSQRLSADNWVVEGSAPDVFRQCVDEAQTVIYLNYNRISCLRSVFSRNVLGNRIFNPNNVGRKSLGISRANYILRQFPAEQRAQVSYLRRLESDNALTKDIYIVESRAELERLFPISVELSNTHPFEARL